MPPGVVGHHINAARFGDTNTLLVAARGIGPGGPCFRKTKNRLLLGPAFETVEAIGGGQHPGRLVGRRSLPETAEGHPSGARRPFSERAGPFGLACSQAVERLGVGAECVARSASTCWWRPLGGDGVDHDRVRSVALEAVKPDQCSWHSSAVARIRCVDCGNGCWRGQRPASVVRQLYGHQDPWPRPRLMTQATAFPRLA